MKIVLRNLNFDLPVLWNNFLLELKLALAMPKVQSTVDIKLTILNVKLEYIPNLFYFILGFKIS